MTPDSVVVAMSGGVDSAVAAALLRERGCDVRGLTLNLWPRPTAPPGDEAGGAPTAVEQARSAADRLGIPHTVVDLEPAFLEQVVRPFVDEYRRGRTPNPCVRCNRLIKFEALREQARRTGARFVATGHYARVECGGGRATLRRGLDEGKDQSYALWGLERGWLGEILLPIGGLAKSEVRERARALGLPMADRPESQDVCFVEGGDYARFLEEGFGEIARAVPGPIVDTHGKVLGGHGGVMRYTVGQRKGLGLARPRPTYVVRIDAAASTLIVGDEAELFQRSFEVREVNFVSIDPPAVPFRAKVQVRYRGRLIPGTVRPLGGDTWRVDLEEAGRAITPGQSAVFYEGDVLLGGGVIERVPAGEEGSA